MEDRIATTRNKIRARFEKALGGEEGPSSAAVAHELESALWNFGIDGLTQQGVRPICWENRFVVYRITTNALILEANLKRNAAFRDLAREKRADEVVRLIRTPWVIEPEKWEVYFEKAAMKQLRKQLTVDVDSVPDGALTCFKCKSKKTTFYEMQTRAADEPATIFAACLKCNNRWKQ